MAWLSALKRVVRRLERGVALLRNLPELRNRCEILEKNCEALEKNHHEMHRWLQDVYPQIVQSVGQKLDETRFNQHCLDLERSRQDLLAVIHREIASLRHDLHKAQLNPSGNAVVLPPGPAEDVDMAGFYLALERGFRGSESQVREKLLPHLQYLLGKEVTGTVLDLGCGRGEWLTLLKNHQIEARGVDLNPINGDSCRLQGLDVLTGNAIEVLEGLPEASLEVITAFHLIEHLPFAELIRLTDQALRCLRPGGILIYETPNPENLLVATKTFWYDPTHIRLLPPELIEFLLGQRGFAEVKVMRLHPDESQPLADPLLQQLLRGDRDFAVIAHKADA